MSPSPLVPPVALASQDNQQQDPDRALGPAVDWQPVQDALTLTTDALTGFERMAELAEPEFVPTVRRYVDLHRRHAETLSRLLADMGMAPDADGSFMGTVNRTVVSARSLFDKIDADVLDQIRSGEDHIVSAYQDALETPLPPAARDRLTALLHELRQLVAETAGTR